MSRFYRSAVRPFAFAGTAQVKSVEARSEAREPLQAGTATFLRQLRPARFSTASWLVCAGSRPTGPCPGSVHASGRSPWLRRPSSGSIVCQGWQRLQF